MNLEDRTVSRDEIQTLKCYGPFGIGCVSRMN